MIVEAAVELAVVRWMRIPQQYPACSLQENLAVQPTLCRCGRNCEVWSGGAEMQPQSDHVPGGSWKAFCETLEHLFSFRTIHHNTVPALKARFRRPLLSTNVQPSCVEEL